MDGDIQAEIDVVKMKVPIIVFLPLMLMKDKINDYKLKRSYYKFKRSDRS